MDDRVLFTGPLTVLSPSHLYPLGFQHLLQPGKKELQTHRAQIKAAIRQKLYLLQNLTLWCVALTPHLKIDLSYFYPLCQANGYKSYQMQEADEILRIAYN